MEVCESFVWSLVKKGEVVKEKVLKKWVVNIVFLVLAICALAMTIRNKIAFVGIQIYIEEDGGSHEAEPATVVLQRS